MIRWYFLLLITLVTFASTNAQDLDINAWFDLGRDEAGLAVIEGIAVNQSTKTLAYSYSMRLTKTGPSGNAISTQSGSFTLSPEEQKTLSAVSINLGTNAAFEIILKVFDDEKVVAEKKIVSDEKFLSDFKKIPPKPVIATKETIPSKNNNTPPKVRNTDALEIDGLIIDETRSKTGRDFYDQFYGKWVAPKEVSDFSIIIRELPARGRGARVSVEVNGNLVVRRMLQPRLDIIELLAEQSVNAVKKHLTDAERVKKDLEKGDQQGSGLY